MLQSSSKGPPRLTSRLGLLEKHIDGTWMAQVVLGEDSPQYAELLEDMRRAELAMDDMD